MSCMSLLLAYDHYMLGSRVIVVKMPQAAVPEGDMRLLGQALGCSRVCGCISSTSRKRRCALEKCAGGKESDHHGASHIHGEPLVAGQGYSCGP